MSEEVILDTSNFDREVLESDKPVLVDFWAQWCGPCKMVGPIVEEIAREFKETLKVGKLEVDAAGDIASKYGIVSIPTLIVFKNGEPVRRQVGAVSKTVIEEMVQEFI